MKKKILSLILTICIFLSLITVVEIQAAGYVAGFPLEYRATPYEVSVLSHYSSGQEHTTHLYNWGALKNQPEDLKCVMDIAAPGGTPIYAVADGKVVENTSASSAGNYVVIAHYDGSYSYYGHMKYRSSVYGNVSAGQLIGYVGRTGAASGNHIHFEWSHHDAFCDYKEKGYVKIMNNSGASIYPHRCQIIPNGTYVIASDDNMRYFLDAGEVNIKVRKGRGNDVLKQKFSVTHVENNYYQIVSADSHRALGEEGGKRQIRQYEVNGSDTQLWKIAKAENGCYTLCHKKSGLYLTEGSFDIANVADALLASNSGEKSSWKLLEIGANCSHSYNSMGVCERCGGVFPLEVVSINARMATSIKSNAPVRSYPYEEADVKRKISAGMSVTVIAYAYNSYNNLWFKTSDGNWIYSGNLAITGTNKSVFSNPTVTAKNGGYEFKAKLTYTGTRPSNVGMYLGTTKTNMKEVGRDKIGTLSSPFDVWYQVNAIAPGVTYYYQFYSIVDDIPKRSEIFTYSTNGGTKGIEPEVNNSASSVRFTVNNASKITRNEAHVSASCAYTGTRPSEVGLLMGFKENAMVKMASDVVNFSKNPFDVWYDLVGMTEGTTYYYQFYTVVNGVTYKSDIKSFTTAKGTTNTAIEALNSIKITVNTPTGITKTTAKVQATCSYTGTRPSEVGLYLGTSASNLTLKGKDAINFSKNPFDIWYELSSLTQDTTYYYQFYAVVNGKTYKSDIKSFTTAKGTVDTAVNAISPVKMTVTTPTSVTQTSARVQATYSYTGTRPSEAGLYIGTSSTNLAFKEKDVINFSKNPFDVWYDLTNLSQGTTYYYQFYVIVNGITYKSEVKSFTTARGTTNTLVNALGNSYQAYVINTNYLALNNKAAASPKYSTEIAAIPKNATVTVYPDKSVGNWYYVYYNGKYGYAYGTYLKRK